MPTCGVFTLTIQTRCSRAASAFECMRLPNHGLLISSGSWLTPELSRQGAPSTGCNTLAQPNQKNCREPIGLCLGPHAWLAEKGPGPREAQTPCLPSGATARSKILLPCLCKFKLGNSSCGSIGGLPSHKSVFTSSNTSPNCFYGGTWIGAATSKACPRKTWHPLQRFFPAPVSPKLSGPWCTQSQTRLELPQLRQVCFI